MLALQEQIKQFCIDTTPEILAQLQKERFDNQGDFNGNDRWDDNALDVIADKGRDEPLVDTGNLRGELESASNWDLSPVSSDNSLSLTIPEEENFTDSKYDKLQDGGYSESYISPRGTRIRAKSLPARNFKKLSHQDATWVVEKLVLAIKGRFA